MITTQFRNIVSDWLKLCLLLQKTNKFMQCWWCYTIAKWKQ